MHFINRSITSLVWLLFANQIVAQAQDQKTKEKIRMVERSLVGPVQMQGNAGWSIHERMAHYKVNGVSIAVIRNYKVEWTKAYGWADKTKKTPVTVKTLFQAGSISKSLNAVGVLKLMQDGKIDLHTDINQYLTSWRFPYDAKSKGKKITIANLLSHTAGLGVSGFSGYETGHKIPSLVQILDDKPPANSSAVRSIFEPGLRYEYSGGGITITQMIVNDLVHQPYSKYMEENVLKPLRMYTSTFTQPQAKNAGKLFATGYYENGRQIEGRFHTYPEQAAAGLWSSPTELANYIIAIQEAYRGKTNHILTPTTAKLMLTPYIDQRAALGVFISDYSGKKYFEHSGLTYGYFSQYYGSLSDGNGIVIMTNSVNTALIPEIVNSIAKVYGFEGLYRSRPDKAVKINDTLLQAYTGRYKLSPETILTVSKEGGQLFIQLDGEDKIPVFAETANKFYLKVTDAQLEFVKGTNGKVIKVILYQDGSANHAMKLY